MEAKIAAWPTFGSNFGQQKMLRGLFVFLDVSDHSADFNCWDNPIPPSPLIGLADRAHSRGTFLPMQHVLKSCRMLDLTKMAAKGPK